MSQTTQFVSIPATEGRLTAQISSTAWGVGGATIEDGSIKFTAGPDLIGARYVRRNVIVQGTEETVPVGYKSAGEVKLGGKPKRVLVEMPSS